MAADFFDIQTDGSTRFLSKDGLSSYLNISSSGVTLYASGVPAVTASSGQVNITGDAQVQGNVKGTFDNTYDLGTPSVRWDDVYATNGTIQTSDATEKDDIAALTAAEKRVGQACMGLFKKFRWKSAKAEKGEAARTHLGIMAQEVEAIFVAEGLDPFAYGVLAKGPTFDDVVEDVVDENGNVNKRPVMAVNGKVKTTPRLDADGNQKMLYGIRKDELYALIFASMAP